MENRENCSRPTPPQQNPKFIAGILYQFADDNYCVFVDQSLRCVEEFRDSVCLNEFATFNSNPQRVSATLAGLSYVMEDRHELCQSYDPSLLPTGTSLELQRSINFRSTPGGGLLGQVPSAAKLQSLDFEIRGATTRDRYYKVRFNGQDGWLYAGTKTDAETWITKARVSPWPNSVAIAAEKIKIVSPNGINLRTVPGGTLITLIPVGSVLTVLEVAVQGTNNYVYYKVSTARGVGYIYSGQLLPASSVEQWTLRTK
jgi:hypothetical protein